MQHINLYNYHFKDQNLSTRKKIEKINSLISSHEEEITNPLLEYLSKNSNYLVIGKNKIENKNRAPTIAFVHKNKSSKEITEPELTPSSKTGEMVKLILVSLLSCFFTLKFSS